MGSQPLLAEVATGDRRWFDRAIRLLKPANRRGKLAGTLLFGVLLFVVLSRLSALTSVTSDSANAVLEGQAIAEGNWLLHGWTLSGASFIATDLPFYVVFAAFQGLSPAVAHNAGALVYTLLVLAACYLARAGQPETGGLLKVAIVIVVLLSAAAGAATSLLLLGPFHVGTTLLLVLSFLIAARPRYRLARAVAVWALLTLAVLSDTLALYVGVLPLLLVCIRRLASSRPRRHPSELPLLVAGLLSVPSADALAGTLRVLGGFTPTPLQAGFVRLDDLPRNLQLTVDGILLIFGTDFLRQPFSLAVLLHLAAVVFVGCVWVRCFGRFQRTGRIDLVTELLLVCMTADVAAYLVSNQAVDLWTTRYLVPLLVFGAVLAAREGAEWLSADRLRGPALAVGLMNVGVVGIALATPSPPSAEASVGDFLEKHNLTYGLGGYWQASTVTVATGGRVRVRAVYIPDDAAHPYLWEAEGAWYDSGGTSNDARFVLREVGGPHSLSREAVEAAFGPPSREYRVGGYEVLVWDRNLLGDLRQ